MLILYCAGKFTGHVSVCVYEEISALHHFPVIRTESREKNWNYKVDANCVDVYICVCDGVMCIMSMVFWLTKPTCVICLGAYGATDSLKHKNQSSATFSRHYARCMARSYFIIYDEASTYETDLCVFGLANNCHFAQQLFNRKFSECDSTFVSPFFSLRFHRIALFSSVYYVYIYIRYSTEHRHLQLGKIFG